MCADLEHSPLTTRYVSEIHRLWDLASKLHNNGKKLAEIIKDQIQALANNNVKLTVASESSKGEQKNIEKLTQVTLSSHIITRSQRSSRTRYRR